MKEEINLDGTADNTYTVLMVCTNCGCDNHKTIPYGTTIEEREPVCVSCLCRTLVKKESQ